MLDIERSAAESTGFEDQNERKLQGRILSITADRFRRYAFYIFIVLHAVCNFRFIRFGSTLAANSTMHADVT